MRLPIPSRRNRLSKKEHGQKTRKRRSCRPAVEQLEARTTPTMVPLTISFTHLHQIDNPDSDGSDGDYYARVTIGSNPAHVTSRIEDDDFNPSAVNSSWTITDKVDMRGGPVSILIELFDFDNFLNGNDDTLDINPDPNHTAARISVDPINGTWTGTVTSPNNALEGDGGGGFDRTRLEFQITTPFTGLTDTDGDGLPDKWETSGIDLDGDGVPELTLPGADPNHKDLYVEADAMAGLAPKPLSSIPITDATNASPIVITSAGAGLSTGTRITISGVNGNSAANNTFTVTRVDADHFRLDGSSGTGNYAGGGTWALADLAGTGLATNTDLDLVIDAFHKAPVSNPDGKAGVNLHIQVDETNVTRQPWDTDLDKDGQSPYGEDTNANGVLDPGEDKDGDGKIGFGDADDQGGYPFFKAFKQAQFGTASERGNAAAIDAKRLAYRYVVFADYWVASLGKDDSGNSKGVTLHTSGVTYNQSDFVVSLGKWADTSEEQVGTFMHEFGHTLGLDHGGPGISEVGLETGTTLILGLADTSDFVKGLPVSGAGIPDKTTIASVGAGQITLSQPATLFGLRTINVGDPINYKPNYPSVMNYTWQLSNGDFPGSWRLDYSHGTYPTLDEGHLNEKDGIGGQPGRQTQAGPTPAQVVNETGNVDWSRTDADGNGHDDDDLDVPADLTHVDANDPASPGQVLKDHNDWAHLHYAIGTAGLNDAATFDEDHPHLTLENVHSLSHVLEYDAPSGNGADVMTLRKNGDMLQIIDDHTGAVLAQNLVVQIDTVKVIGANGEDDTLTVSFSGGNPIPSKGVSFDGGSGGVDTLVFAGTLPGTPSYTPDAGGGPDRGAITLGASVVRFTGLEYVRPVAPHITGVQLDKTSIDENQLVTLTGQFTDPGSLASHTVTVNWGDGVTDAPVSLAVGARSFTLTHRYLDDNPTGTASDINHLVVTVTDNDNLTDTATPTETVNNVPPQLRNVAVTSSIDENGTVTLSGDILDPGTLDTFTLTVNWGEGAPQSFSYGKGTTHFSETHQYLDDNPTATPQDTYAVHLALSDDDTGQASADTSTLVVNLPPVITASAIDASSATPGKEGVPTGMSASFTDVGTLDTHTATVDWNDGTIDSATITEGGGAGSLTDSHAYTDGGIYTIIVTLHDDDTGTATTTRTLFITGVGVHKLPDGRTALEVIGSAGDDSVMIDQLGDGTFKVHASFLAEGARDIQGAGIDVLEIVTLGGNDQVTVAGNINTPAVIDGGEGDDRLNGGGGTNILIGGSGSDFINGGNARDFLIGGVGADRLVGNGNDDILIGGFTSYDSGSDDAKLTNDLVLLQLMQEWNSARLYTDRVANLQNGTGPVLAGTGHSFRKNVTVFDDADADVMTGSSGSDWFFFDFRDTVTDQKNGEFAN